MTDFGILAINLPQEIGRIEFVIEQEPDSVSRQRYQQRVDEYRRDLFQLLLCLR
jgi:hypothetical protein